MNIFWILDPDSDPHNNRCGSATLFVSSLKRFSSCCKKSKLAKSATTIRLWAAPAPQYCLLQFIWFITLLYLQVYQQTIEHPSLEKKQVTMHKIRRFIAQRNRFSRDEPWCVVAFKKSVNEKTLKGTNTGTGTVPVFLCCHCRVREKMYFTSLFCESLDRMNSQSSESSQQNE